MRELYKYYKSFFSHLNMIQVFKSIYSTVNIQQSRHFANFLLVQESSFWLTWFFSATPKSKNLQKLKLFTYTNFLIVFNFCLCSVDIAFAWCYPVVNLIMLSQPLISSLYRDWVYILLLPNHDFRS